jgi:predicted histidine transporter YuiF (NhaC family)
MKTEHKLLLRNISSYAMIITALLIVFWFLFVIVTSALNFNVYSGDSIELMVFILFMALVVIGIAAVINISLSIDLIAEARIQELKLKGFSTT